MWELKIGEREGWGGETREREEREKKRGNE
jgi:hypothetical protein